MKFNKWTVALAALGVVSFASAAKAEEKASPVMTALAATTISGYIDTSAEWNPNGNAGNANLPPYRFNSPNKADGFNLDVIQLRIDKPLDESDWAAGYRADLWFGPDANTLNTTSSGVNSSDFAIRQAYVALRAPVGTGLDFKMGVFDSIIGYESLEAGNNPNFTRSYGNSMEPTTQTGLLASYRFCDAFSASAGVANTAYSAINSRAQLGSVGASNGGAYPSGPNSLFWNNLYQGTSYPATGTDPKAESFKSYMGSIALTAPDSMGFLTGSTLYAGIVSGYNNSILGSGVGANQTSYYVGATVATPVTGLRLGAAFDYVNYQDLGASAGGWNLSSDPYAWATAGYVSYQATEKLSFHARAEYTEQKWGFQADTTPVGPPKARIFAATFTTQYDLWKNVISRLEFRWDRSVNGNEDFQGTEAGMPVRFNAFLLAANVIYKF
jgi:Putative beta-barrel porin-2, OmpL-like. bbp2